MNYCPKCGASLNPGDAVCSKCGNPVGTQEQNMPDGKDAATETVSTEAVSTETVSTENIATSNRKKKRVIAVAVVAVIVIILIALLFGGRSDKAIIKQYVNATFEPDAAALTSLVPEEVMEEELENMGYDDDEINKFNVMLQNRLERQIISLDEYYGENWKISYDIQSDEDTEQFDFYDIKDDYAEIGIAISAAKTVGINLTIKSEDGEISNTQHIDISLIKVSRSWYLDIINTEGIWIG